MIHVKKVPRAFADKKNIAQTLGISANENILICVHKFWAKVLNTIVW